jgi:hypothetical protein
VLIGAGKGLTGQSTARSCRAAGDDERSAVEAATSRRHAIQ